MLRPGPGGAVYAAIVLSLKLPRALAAQDQAGRIKGSGGGGQGREGQA